MKKYFALLLAILFIVSLMACGAKESEGPPYYFIGEVTEIYESEGTFLVKVTDYGNYKFSSKYVIIHETANCPDYRVGDYFLLEFNGLFLETDPPQLKNAIVGKTDSEGNLIEMQEFSFQATVLEVNENSLLVEPVQGCPERNSADRIELSLQDKTSWPMPQVGDTVDVFYNGELMETYPARIGKLYRVEIVF